MLVVYKNNLIKINNDTDVKIEEVVSVTQNVNVNFERTQVIFFNPKVEYLNVTTKANVILNKD